MCYGDEHQRHQFSVKIGLWINLIGYLKGHADNEVKKADRCLRLIFL